MSAFVEVKSDFLRVAAQAGWTSPAEIPLSWRDSIPYHILLRWLRQLGDVVKVNPAEPRRLVNHFKLGADPEFVFLRSDGDRQDASSLGFKAAVAWGADNNGRLVEIRPCPSRHALGVATSIWATLNWMARFQPTCLAYSWRSGAWVAGDGVGGHVHFGRKRPSWPREMQALDTLAFWLQHVNIFSQAEWRERIRRTRGRGNYGQLGDRREQLHGWEYRTIPSWLDSPWLAYAILTLSKLAVYDPEFLPPLAPDAADQSAGVVRAKLKGLLVYFKGRDDDAALAHQIFSRHGWPHFDMGDFKSRWGIFGNPTLLEKPPNYTLPNMVPVNPSLLTEFGQALLENRIPEWNNAAPTWSPAQLPPGYLQVMEDTATFHHPGIGELVRDLVVPAIGARPRIMASANNRCEIPSTWLPKYPGDWTGKMRQKFPALSIGTYTPDGKREDTRPIYIPGSLAATAEEREQVIAFLTDGWIPCWHISKVQVDSYAKWQAARKATEVEPPEPKPKPKVSQTLWPIAEVKKKPESKGYLARSQNPLEIPATPFLYTWTTGLTVPPPSEPPGEIRPVLESGRTIDRATGRPLAYSMARGRWELADEPPRPTEPERPSTRLRDEFWDDISPERGTGG